MCLGIRNFSLLSRTFLLIDTVSISYEVFVRLMDLSEEDSLNTDVHPSPET